MQGFFESLLVLKGSNNFSDVIDQSYAMKDIYLRQVKFLSLSD